MSSMMSQMEAIWSALDEMLEKDPEKYQKFIAEQMTAGKAVLQINKNLEKKCDKIPIPDLEKLKISDEKMKSDTEDKNEEKSESNFELKLPIGPLVPTKIEINQSRKPKFLIQEIGESEVASASDSNEI